MIEIEENTSKDNDNFIRVVLSHATVYDKT